jgi:parallel beta-helix repeat protein
VPIKNSRGGILENIDEDRKRAEVFDALGHPTRILILKALNEGPLGFADLKKKTHIDSSGHLTHHLNKLNGLIKTDEYGQYCLSDQGKDALLTVETVENVAGTTSKNGRGPTSNSNGKRTVLKVLAIGLAVLLIASAAINIYEYTQVTTLQNHISEQDSTINQLQKALNDLTGQHNSGMLIVPDNYPTIQSAINSASSGDTVFVKKGVYYENPVITTSISLIGENRNETIIMLSSGRGGSNGISVQADNTIVSGFTIETKPDPSVSLLANGIALQAGNVQIIGNNIRNCYSAITADNSGSSSIISENYITSNTFIAVHFLGNVQNITISKNIIASNPDSSIAIYGSQHTISENTITDSRWGVGLYTGSNNAIFGNTILNCSLYGIGLYQSSNNTIYSNQVENNAVGISFSQRDDAAPMNHNLLYHNNFVNNGQNTVMASGAINYWDNGQEGNYWSDYSTKYPNAVEANNSGIGNTPYVIDAKNSDHYPLLESWIIAH